MKTLLAILFFLPFLVSAHTMTAVGNAQIDTAQSKFGGASGLMNTETTLTTGGVTAPDSSDFDLGSGAFTIAGFVRFATTVTVEQGVVAQTDAGSDIGWEVEFHNSAGQRKMRFGKSTNGSNYTVKDVNVTISADTWYHFAVTRSGDTLHMFFDGTEVGTQDLTGITIWNSSADLGVGRDVLQNLSLNGWLDEVSIQKGTARWTSGFTPPTSADCGEPNVVLLLHMDGADASTTFTDDSATACGGGGGGYEDIDVISDD